LTPEHRAALSRARTGKKHSPEHCQAMSRALRGKKKAPFSDAHRAAISAGLSGKTWTPEHKAAMGRSVKARLADPAARKAVSDRLKGHPTSPKTRAKIQSSILAQRDEMVTRTRALWADPSYREKTVRGIVGALNDRDAPSRLHLKVKAGLTGAGLTDFVTHVPVGFYCLDEADVGRKVVVEVNGCFWHACPICVSAGAVRAVVRNKRNLGRDKAKRTYLKNHGWTLIEIWEHEWEADPAGCIQRVRAVLG